MSNSIFEEEGKKPAATVQTAQQQIEKQARQLAYDTRYQVKKQIGDKKVIPVVAVDMEEAEKIGLIKIDALGLKTLSVINDTIKIIKEREGTDIDLLKIDMDDQKVYQMLSEGYTKGVFQCEATPYTNLLIKMRVKNYRHAAEQGIPDPLAPIGEDGKLTYKWMELPYVISIRISDQYFDGIPWNALKHDRTLKAQFYRVVEQEYPEYVCYPGGKLPIPVNVAYPTKKGEKKYFRGN